MQQPVRSYIRAQGGVCALINAVLNPAVAWLVNRQMAFVPLDSGIVVDTAVTSLVLSLLVSLFVTPAARRELHAGRLKGTEAVFRENGVLARLPARAWSLGLVIGIVAAVVLAPLMFATFHVLRLPGLPFAEFALLKAAYTAALGFAVTRWVILRQVLYHRASSSHAG